VIPAYNGTIRNPTYFPSLQALSVQYRSSN